MSGEQSMSEHDVGAEGRVLTRTEASSDALSSDASPPKAYGARLAWERQRAGLSVTDVAATLRLHPNQVRAIEQEDLTRLPELAYVRGFIRSYARVLNVDAAPMLGDLNDKLAPSGASVVDAMTTTSDYSPVRAAARERMSRQVVMAVAVIGLIALGIIGWQSTLQGQQAPAPAAITAAPPIATAPVEQPAIKEEQSVPAAEQPSQVSEPASAVVASEPSTAPPMLWLRFSGKSWVEVTDANGKILLLELSSAGVEHMLNGAAPLTVVIGDANTTSVSVHGEAFNLQPFTRNNVARFTVKAQ